MVVVVVGEGRVGVWGGGFHIISLILAKNCAPVESFQQVVQVNGIRSASKHISLFSKQIEYVEAKKKKKN